MRIAAIVVSHLSSLRPFWGLRASCAAFALGGVVCAPSTVSAQTHWDASAEAGIEKRFLRARPIGTPDAGFGPVGKVSAHVAFFPLIRVGGYGTFSFSPISDGPSRTLFGGGLEFRLVPPIRLPNLHAYVFTGVGYMAARSAKFETVPSAGGGCLDIPLGAAMAYRLRKPFEVGAALGTHFSAACSGSLYAAPLVTSARNAYSGVDVFGLNLTAVLNVEL